MKHINKLLFLIALFVILVPVSADPFIINFTVPKDDTWYLISFENPKILYNYTLNSSVNYANAHWEIYGTNDNITYQLLANQTGFSFNANTVYRFNNTCSLVGYTVYYVNFFSGFTNPSADLIMVFNPSTVSSDFYANVTSGEAPLSVKFTDLSTGSPYAWNWSFGDGYYSTNQTAEHVYNNPGIYTVSLAIISSYGTDVKTKTDYINVFSGNVLLDFVGVPTVQIYPNKTVDFTGYSYALNPDSWNWSFGDGTYSNLQNPSHDYPSFGFYTVSLSGLNGTAFNTTTKTNYITIQENIFVNFTVIPNVGTILNTSGGSQIYPTIYFTDISNNATAWLWDFGDGNTSILKNPLHQYTEVGVYNVTLTASNVFGLVNSTTINGSVIIVSRNWFNLKADIGETYIKWSWYTSDSYNIMVDGKWVTTKNTKVVDVGGVPMKYTNATKLVTSLGTYAMESLEPNSEHTLAIYSIGNDTPVAQSTVKTLPHSSTVFIVLCISLILCVISTILIYRSVILSILLGVFNILISLYGFSTSFNTNGLQYIFLCTLIYNAVLIGYILYKTFKEDVGWW